MSAEGDPAAPPRAACAERLLGGLLRLIPSPVVTVILVGHLILNLGFLLPKCLSGWFVMVDGHVYARAAQNVWRGAGLYPLTPTGDLLTPDHQPMPFLYSPAFAALLGPLGWLSTDALVRVFFVLAFVSFWGIAAVLARIVNGRVTWRGVLGAGYVAMMTPDMTLLQLLFALAMVGVAPGLLLGASLLVKPFAAWPLAIMALRQPRRIIPTAAGALVVGVVVGAIVCGPGSYSQWLRYSQDTMYGLIFGNMNTSLGLLPLRLLGYTALPGWGRGFLTGMFVLFPALVAWVMRGRAAPIQASWVAATALLFAPFSHHYYLPLLLVPMAFEVRGILDAMVASAPATTAPDVVS